MWLFVIPWTAACLASLSFTISLNLLKLMSIESVMPSNHLILWLPFCFRRDVFFTSHSPRSLREVLGFFSCAYWLIWDILFDVYACVLSHSVVSDSLWPHRRQPARPLCPWDCPGKHTGVACHALLQRGLPYPGIKPKCLVSPVLAGGFFTSAPPGKHLYTFILDG